MQARREKGEGWVGKETEKKPSWSRLCNFVARSQKKMFLHKSQLQLYDNQKYTQKAMV